MTMTRRLSRRRGVALLVALVLILALALAACGGRGAVHGGGGNGAPNANQQAGGNAGTGSDLSGDEQQIDSLMNQLNGAANDANFDYSGMDTETVP